MELIVTEKDNAARRIAEILSDGTSEMSRVHGTNVYSWDERRCLGLSGHVVEVDFPPMYSDWRDVEPVELIGAQTTTEVTREEIVDALQDLAREADRAIIATDYDREGELIGKEAFDLIREVTSAPVDRVRFSSITQNEVKSAFSDPDDIDFNLAAAGEARQTIDLVWGAALTRFLSLSAGRRGDDFISVGRVQGPTLKLLVDREREIRAFDPEAYWELFAELVPGEEGTSSFESQYFYEDDAGNQAERIWDESTAETVYDALRTAETATVQSVRRRTRTDNPPAPFDTTTFIRAAGSLGFGAQRAMSIAEDLYTAGFITYPRTDNTVYPNDLDPRDLLEEFTESQFDEAVSRLLDRDTLDPTEGDQESTDHPPIHPTGELPERDDLTDDEWEIYELVVRRFFATLATEAVWERLRVVADATPDEGETGPDLERELSVKATGRRLLSQGYHAVYPYGSTTESRLPSLSEGQQLPIRDVRLEAKQTKPPRRYGQSRLVEKMKELGVGTKSTRHNTIEKLYDRGYVEDDPPRPTRLAEAVVDAAEAFADRIVSEEMTAQLEADMAAIAEGEKTLEEVTAESREMLERVFDELTESRDEVGEHLRESLKADRTLGPCPECGSDLLIRQSSNGSNFIGCDGYPSCDFTLPLPSTGRPVLLDEVCEEHGLSHVKMLAGRKTFVHGCPQCQADAAEEEPDRVIGTCPDCGRDHGGQLAIKRTRSGSRLVGCTRYPECDYSLPLPRRGDIEITDQSCDEHGLPRLRVRDGGDEPWDLGCPICNYREYRARQEGSELETVEGIGEKTAAKLKDAGIEDVGSLKEAEPSAVAEVVDGVGPDTVRDWQANAD